MEYFERLPTRLNPLAVWTCSSQADTNSAPGICMANGNYGSAHGSNCDGDPDGGSGAAPRRSNGPAAANEIGCDSGGAVGAVRETARGGRKRRAVLRAGRPLGCSSCTSRIMACSRIADANSTVSGASDARFWFRILNGLGNLHQRPAECKTSTSTSR